jgi:hypothetical protein
MFGLDRLLAKLVGKVVINQLLWRDRTPKVQETDPIPDDLRCENIEFSRRLVFDLFRRRAEQGGYLNEYLEETSKDGKYLDLVEEFKVIQEDFVMGKEREDWILG